MGKQFLSLHQLYVYGGLSGADDIASVAAVCLCRVYMLFFDTAGLWIQMN